LEAEVVAWRLRDELVTLQTTSAWMIPTVRILTVVAPAATDDFPEQLPCVLEE
jgi:hypothetical protein